MPEKIHQEVNFLAICWILFALLSMYLSFNEPTINNYIISAIGGIVGVCGIGLLMKWRWSAKLMVIILGLNLPLAIWIVIKKGFTTKYLFKIFMMLYTIKILIDWLKLDIEHDNESKELLRNNLQ